MKLAARRDGVGSGIHVFDEELEGLELELRKLKSLDGPSTGGREGPREICGMLLEGVDVQVEGPEGGI